MTAEHSLFQSIDLGGSARITREDAARQTRTAIEILRRLKSQPGLILADEVGMGKTFVALAVAVSVAATDPNRRPVVVMVPPSLREKWPADFQLFRECCLPDGCRDRFQAGFADNAVGFLRLLDDPLHRRKAILFVTHGAMSRGLTDRWVKAALIYQALKGRWEVDRLRRRLSRVMSTLLLWKYQRQAEPEFWEDLLRTPPHDWLRVFKRWEIDSDGDSEPSTDDEPVPEAVLEVLPDLDLSEVCARIREIPQRQSKYFEEKVIVARQAIQEELRRLWKESLLSRLRLRLPLLVLDEAHHLKNPETKLAGLFQIAEAEADIEEVQRGALAGVFERMLFLTATPFQLGHRELCSVLERFGGINWKSSRAPGGGIDVFESTLEELRVRLDAAQDAAVALDRSWGGLRSSDLAADNLQYSRPALWWEAASHATELTSTGAQVVRCYRHTAENMKAAEDALRPWVIRHRKPKYLLSNKIADVASQYLPRRCYLIGRADLDEDSANSEELGIEVEGDALLPFLLAARAASLNPKARPVFAEGLASSYEAFRDTRIRTLERQGNLAEALDGDDDPNVGQSVDEAASWYLSELERILPRAHLRSSMSHPKVRYTIANTIRLWRDGEKVVVFCHYVVTGRILRQAISAALADEIHKLAAGKLGCSRKKAEEHLARIGRRFFDTDSPVRHACDREVSGVLREFPSLVADGLQQPLLDIVRRNLRTPSILARFFPLDSPRITEDAVRLAMEAVDSSGMSLREILADFFRFLEERCGQQERRRYLDALEAIQVGQHFGSDDTGAYSDDELQGDKREALLPNVRLVNGATRSETRQRLMLAFNTPFYPEILIASSVLAEGVDLHLSCRHVIHHDLCWNPSTLEQRTGRIDRIGSKAERCGRSILVAYPFVAETQDEKMYRVVMDRERWFGVVMGEDYKPDLATTDRLAERVPFPLKAAEALAFHLETDNQDQR